MFENFKFHISIKYFLFLVGFLLIPFMALGLLLTNYVMSEYKSEIYDMAQNSVDYICSMVENELEDIYEIKALVGQDEQVKNFSNYPAGVRRGDKVYEAYEVSKIMESHCAYRDIVTEIHLYSELRDTVVVPNGIYTRKEYYDTFLTDSGISYELWCNAIDVNDESISPLIYNATIQNQRKNVAMVNVLHHGGKKDSAMFVVLDMNRILDIYERVTKEMPKMYFAVLSGKQIVIVSDKMPEVLDEQLLINCDSREQLENGFVAFKSVSADGGLTFLCVASEDVIQEKFVDAPSGRVVNPGHSMEAAWFLMMEGIITKNQAAIDAAKRIIDITWPLGWDEKHGGIIAFTDVCGKPPVQLEWDMKLWWPQCENMNQTIGNQPYKI